MMKSHALSQHAVPMLRSRPHTGAWLRFLSDRFLWLPIGAAIALVWANTYAESYFGAAHALAFPVNEIGMALFLGLITQESIDAIMPGGALHTWRRWAMPIVAAAGGTLGATFVFLGYVSGAHETVLAQAWPVACAIDIAAGYYVLTLIFRRSSALPFFLVLAMASNAAGVAALALWPAFTPDHLDGAVLLVAAVALAATMRRSRVRTFWPYLVLCGTMSWWAFYWAGVHPALALIPIVPFLPHQPRPLNLFEAPATDDAVPHAEHQWHLAVQIVLFLFGLVNAGVILRGYDTGTWAVLSAAVIGRPLGILGAVGLAMTLGLRLPRSIGWRELTVIALATSSGFTFALFTATSLLPVGGVLTPIKVGALSTVLGGVAAYVVARLLRVGRFGGHTTRQ
jgi:NhaA family Na+:H+ antiporter